MQPSIHMFELPLDLGIGREILSQQMDLLKHLVHFFWRQGQQRLKKVPLLRDTPFGGHLISYLSLSVGFESNLISPRLPLHLQLRFRPPT